MDTSIIIEPLPQIKVALVNELKGNKPPSQHALLIISMPYFLVHHQNVGVIFVLTGSFPMSREEQQQLFCMRQQQRVLSVRKRSGSNNEFCLCESEAAATTVFWFSVCAKAKRQQQRFSGFLSVRKRSDSNNGFLVFCLCESDSNNNNNKLVVKPLSQLLAPGSLVKNKCDISSIQL